MFWSKLCKSSWNYAWNLAFPVFISPTVWIMCENFHYESAYVKELHNKQEYHWPTIYKTGEAVVSTITSHYFIQCYMYLRLPIFCCTFCGNFRKTGKNISAFEISYWRSYFNLFLIYAVTCDTRKYKPSQIYKQFEVDSSKDRLDTKILT